MTRSESLFSAFNDLDWPEYAPTLDRELSMLNGLINDDVLLQHLNKYIFNTV